MSHYIKKCSCGAVLAQCRCPGPKEVQIILNGCEKCKKNPPPIRGKTSNVVILDDWVNYEEKR